MFRSIILFFRNRKITKNIQQKRLLQFPDLQKYPTMTIMIDNNQRKVVKDIENCVKDSFRPKSIRFVVKTESLQEDSSQSDMMVVIEKNDYNKLGILKKEKVSLLKSNCDDIFINLSDNNENLLDDYIVSCINSKFKIGHSNSNMKYHDLILDYGIEKNNVERLKILYKYLMMLSGNKNEK